MAEAAAFKLLGPVAIELLKKGYSYLGLDVEVDEKLHDLQNIIVPQIEMAIEAVKNSPHKDRLRGWLKSLEEAVCEAEDELDEHDYYLLEQKVKSNAGGGITVCLESLLPIKYLSKIFNMKLKKSLEKLEKTAMKAKEFLPFLSAGGSNVRRSQTTNESGRRVTTSLLAHKVFGRDKQRKDIGDLLHETAGLSVEKCFSVVAIVGVGGSGKTTLAQYVCDYEKKAEAKYFDIIMWVHVFQIFDVEKLTRKMVESASGGECPNLTNLDTLQEKLKNSIRSKKFLLILDDVWNEKEVAEMQLEWEQYQVFEHILWLQAALCIFEPFRQHHASPDKPILHQLLLFLLACQQAPNSVLFNSCNLFIHCVLPFLFFISFFKTYGLCNHKSKFASFINFFQGLYL